MKTLLAATALVAVASTAGAATIHLNTYKSWTSGSHTYSGDGYSVDVSAWQYNGHDALHGSYSKLASWGTYHGGLGIKGPHETVSFKGFKFNVPDQHTVDGKDGNDIAIFDFGDKHVELTSITFAYADKWDKFDVFAFGNGAYHGATATDREYDIKTGGGSSGYSVKTVSISGLDTGSVFGIGAFWDKSQFKIKAIHFEEVTPVPLPAAGWLLLGGLGGLAAMKRRKKS